MGLGNWVKQVTRSDGAASDTEVASSPIQTDTSRRETELVPTAAVMVEGSERTVPADRWVGFIDRITPTSIEGWACDTDNVGAHVTVEAVISNGKRILAVAHMYRKDVEEAGYGDGTCGFFLDLSKLTLKDESAIVRFAESKHPINVEPIEFDAARALLTTDMPSTFFGLMELCAAETKQAAEVSSAL